MGFFSSIKRGFKKAGHAIKHAAKKIGHQVTKTSKKAFHHIIKPASKIAYSKIIKPATHKVIEPAAKYVAQKFKRADKVADQVVTGVGNTAQGVGSFLNSSWGVAIAAGVVGLILVR